MIKTRFEVRPIPTDHTKDWLLNKHYAHRLPPISYAFGLYDEKLLVGVCTFGIPASRFNESIKQPYELNRLVVNDGLPKNALSFFVSQCLRLFPQPNIIVSYADPNNGHHGYIYQATNWLYTGLSSSHDDWYINGKLLHAKTIWNMYNTNSFDALVAKGLKVEIKKTLPKYRYFKVVGNKTQRKELLATLKYPILPYPKGLNSRYDSNYMPSTMETLF